MKIFKAMCASILTILLAAIGNFNSNAIEKNIEINGNNFAVAATDLGQLNYIMWTKDCYTCEIDGGSYIKENYNEQYDYITIFMDEAATQVNINLIPTGKFRENTEVIIFGDYHLMAETSINGATIIGDINSDGRNNIADAVVLQKYIMGIDDLSLIEYNRANLNKDEKVDSYDMVLMRQKIIKEN